MQFFFCILFNRDSTSRRKKDDFVTLAADLSHDSISHEGLKELELMMMNKKIEQAIEDGLMRKIIQFIQNE